MRVLFIDLVLNNEMPGIIISVFLHSLWQGLLLSLLAWLLLRSAKKWTPAARYNLLVFFLFAFVACIMSTLLIQLQQPVTVFAKPLVLSQAPTVDPGSFFRSVSEWCIGNAPWIFLLWFFFFMFKVTQLVRGFLAVDKLRKMGIRNSTAEWINSLNNLKGILGIRKKIDLHESRLIHQPIVIGFFKPVILVPLGLLNGLRPQEVEAILLHELAHIRRNDYLVNLFQSLLETVFFFNPFLYWLSEMIRDERELCCDAVAVEHSGDKKLFLEALLSFYQKAAPTPYALGLMGNKSLLIKRIDRIVNDKYRKTSVIEKMTLFASYFILFISLVSFSFLNTKTGRQMSGMSQLNGIFPNRLNASQEKKYDKGSVAVVASSKIVDTIPKKKNASKEFLDGYKAGQQYQAGRSAQTDVEKRQAEQRFADEFITTVTEGGIITTTVQEKKPKDMQTGDDKKRIEHELISLPETKTKQPGVAQTAIQFEQVAKERKRIEEALIAETKNKN